MSNHTARAKPKKSIYFGFQRDDLLALILACVIGLTLLIAYLWKRDTRANWPSVTGQVLETRIVVVNLIDQRYRSGTIVYQAEAHVVYERDGVKQSTWSVASDQTSDKAFLEYWLSQKKSKTCTVRWPPDNPAYAEAVLY